MSGQKFLRESFREPQIEEDTYTYDDRKLWKRKQNTALKIIRIEESLPTKEG